MKTSEQIRLDRLNERLVSLLDDPTVTVDTIEEFQVELQVLYFESIKGVGDNAGGESIS